MQFYSPLKVDILWIFNSLVDEEQMRRIREKEDSNVVKQQLHSVHSELMASVAASEDYQQQVIANDVKETENIKMDMMTELLSSAHKKETDRETEQERSRRIDLLNSMLQDSAVRIKNIMIYIIPIFDFFFIKSLKPRFFKVMMCST